MVKKTLDFKLNEHSLVEGLMCECGGFFRLTDKGLECTNCHKVIG